MKSVMKWFGIIVFVMAIEFSMAACDTGNNDDGDGNGNGNGGGNNGGGGSGIKPTITIKNSTGYFISHIYAKPSTEAKRWKEDLTDGWSVNFDDGKSQTFDVPQSLLGQIDIRLNGGGYDFIKYSITVSNKMTITFTTSDVNNMSSLPKITIQNRSGKNFDSVFIVPSALQPSAPADWGESFGSISNNYDKSDINILIPPTNYTVFDIQARSTNPTNTYTKTNITISNNMTILFTPLDRVNSTIEDPVIVVQNNTGYYVWHIWTRQSDSETWGEDLTGGWSINLDDGNSQTFSVPRTLGNRIDIKLNHNDSYNFIKSGITVSDGLFLTFTADDLEH
jgi:hypothetical protein